MSTVQIQQRAATWGNNNALPDGGKIVDELPPASTWLNYGGDQAALIGHVLGPNTLGELLTVVDCQYDAGADHSRVGLAYGVYVVRAEVPA